MIHVEDNILGNLADVIGCKVGRWPLKDLGMPIGGNPKAVSFWDLVVEKVSRKLVLEEILHLVGRENHVGKSCHL